MTLFLWHVLIIAVLVAVIVYGTFAVLYPQSDVRVTNRLDERVVACGLLSLLIFTSIALRDINYSPDSQTYYYIFSQYCFTSISDLGIDYTVSFISLNAFMLWTCEPDYLIFSWVLLFAAVFAFLPMDRIDRIQMFALAIVSLIGIELTTNILRQGISAAFILLGFAWFRKKPLIAALATALALALHPSAILVVIAAGLALLSWRYFAVGFAGLIVVVLTYANTQTGFTAVDRFFYEMNKYSNVEASEIYIRILSVVQLSIPIICGWIGSKANKTNTETVNKNLVFSLKLALTSLPFLTMPYFGYRYVYGLYLIVLFSNYESLSSRRSTAFEMTLYASLFVTLAWAYGSTLVRTSPFLSL